MKKRFCSSAAIAPLCLVVAVVFGGATAHGGIYATVQPDAALRSDTGYVITFSWEGEGSGWTSGTNGFLDDKTSLANENYVIPSGTFAGQNIGYHNHTHSNGTGHIDWEGVDPNSTVSGSEGRIPSSDNSVSVRARQKALSIALGIFGPC